MVVWVACFLLAQPGFLLASNTMAPTADMIRIPAGEFVMGADQRDGRVGVEVGIDSLPRHRRTLPDFWIDRLEVTNEAYRVFLKSSNRDVPADALFTDFFSWKDGTYPKGLGQHPVIYVTWDDANAFCLAQGKRLPTEAEWEKAARGPDGNRYPWGDEPDNKRCHTRETGIGWTIPVGSTDGDVSPYGVQDMCGNVTEWTDSWYKAYPGSTLTRSSFGEQYKVARGGAWNLAMMPYGSLYSRTLSYLPSKRHRGIGFRCARDAGGG